LVVDRTLLAEAAREQGIDKTPEFLATARRNREQLLADFYVQRIAKTIAAPKPQEIAGYIARHPQVFARREMIAFRRVDVVKTPTAESALRSARDFDAAIRQLASVGAKAVVSSGTLDTGEVSADVAGALEQVKDGRLAIVPLGYALAAYAVGARRATPLVGDDANDAAIRSITLERLSNAVADRLRRARANATIRFQPGLVPPTSAGNPAK